MNAITSAGKLLATSRLSGNKVNMMNVTTTNGSRPLLSAKWEAGIMHRMAASISTVISSPTC